MSYESNIIGLSTVALILLIPPFIWHSHSKNIPAVILLIWLTLMNIKSIVDSAIWSNSDFATNWDGKIWCDIMTKLQMGANIGISCSVTNIVYNLHYILKADQVLLEWDSWKRIVIDLSISLITPICVMGFSYILQVFRYGIARYSGCQNLLTPSWITTVLYTMWMLIWALVGTIYAISLLYIFYKKKKDVKDILHCTNSGLNLARFVRLLIFCLLIILVMFPFSIYTFVQDLQNLQKNFDFKSTHSNSSWNIIIRFDPGRPLYNIWLYILMSYLVFIIFGLGSDALNMYERILYSMKLGFIVELFKKLKPTVNKDSKVGEIFNKIYPISARSNYVDDYNLDRVWSNTGTDNSMVSEVNYLYNSTVSTPVEQEAKAIFYNDISKEEIRFSSSSASSNKESIETYVGNNDNSFIPIRVIRGNRNVRNENVIEQESDNEIHSGNDLDYHFKLERKE
ncbi:hypothetical protein TPHA_0A02700 [Tetrapisispora phaffii CBS 4417]|uniref:Pheromone a factor receptor n=1 Tax=Tetrapisispora phaffii (strain ATCC 24235 / CBS 4417 / NBRC 1672 / NRRL Y-8282 / UCD 70-5) TaxID=1071381 RepID=G8BN74_TETPH|nr:hypothetical protein TPHA_0A02700 [Tetrapisispora phaffii CBS 4417]CCE61352.1 hypothetical protein TPHA_0A02700 [Tetrapisispora phaffii CBS 4417]